jgi:hypothetical protein
MRKQERERETREEGIIIHILYFEKEMYKQIFFLKPEEYDKNQEGRLVNEKEEIEKKKHSVH